MRVDCGAASFLPTCPVCPWRGGVEISRADAMRRADAHAARMHADLVREAAAARQSTRRRALVAV